MYCICFLKVGRIYICIAVIYVPIRATFHILLSVICSEQHLTLHKLHLTAFKLDLPVRKVSQVLFLFDCLKKE